MIKEITKERLEALRKAYPTGCRVVLDEMADKQAPPVGSPGTVTGIDDTGSIMVSWDKGGSLSVLYGIDRCHRIDKEV